MILINCREVTMTLFTSNWPLYYMDTCFGALDTRMFIPVKTVGDMWQDFICYSTWDDHSERTSQPRESVSDY